MLDGFKWEGSNGIHQCLVFELQRPGILDTIDELLIDARLPGKQVLLGLEILHQQKMCHGGRSLLRPCSLE